MTPSIIFTFIYGLLSIVGGIIGFKQAQSKMSLISGSISGLLLLIAGMLLVQDIAAGQWLARIVSLILVIVFVSRLVKTKKFMPAGLMIIAGVATFIASYQ